jgi:hypothetical protein
MSPGASRSGTGAARVRPPRLARGGVVDLERARIERALAARARYRYVQPRVEREGAGWKIVSPNCSRSIDATGGDIEIAWFKPRGDGRWALHARDHAHGAWLLTNDDLSLNAALHLACADPVGRFWP